MRMRLGVRQYIVLGALAQMPALTMRRVDLAKHVNAVAPGTVLTSMIPTLVAAGFIHRYDNAEALRLTELGASTLCERRRAETIVFFRVPNSIMGPYLSE